MENRIIKKTELAEGLYCYRIDSPKIAVKRRAGQFVILCPNKDSERIPLTIANGDPEQGWIEIIFQAAGHTTKELAALDQGESVNDLAGPLGKPTHIEKFGKVLCIGGGVGIAPLFPIVSAMSGAGNDVTTVIGARTKDILILEEDMKAYSSRVFAATDDGSYGHHGFVTDVFKDLYNKGERFDKAVVIGPTVMMKITAGMLLDKGIPTMVSLNPIMVDGTGMCGGCRVTVKGETKFACVDGPEFDAEGIAWDELINRLNSYKDIEKKKMENHNCRLKDRK